MKLYKGEEIRKVPFGWYWATRFDGDRPRIICVYEIPSSLGFKRICLDFGYSSETFIWPNGELESDGFDTVTLFGPIEVPQEIRS